MNSYQTYIGQELALFAHAQTWKRYYRSRIQQFVNGNVLEVGSGLGETTAVLGEIPDTNWTCLEPDPELAAHHRTQLANSVLERDYEIVVGTIESLPADRIFDTIVYIDVLEHIESDAGELRQAATHLRQNGHLIVLSPAHQWLFSAFDAAIGHFRRYDRTSLRAAGPPGLSLVKIEYLDSMGLFTSAANKLILRKPMPTIGQIKFWDRFLIPASTVVDAVLRHRTGKSIYGVWRRP